MTALIQGYSRVELTLFISNLKKKETVLVIE